MMFRGFKVFLALTTLAGQDVAAQTPPEPPFGPGEELIFDVHSARFGRVGQARMGICGPDTVRGQIAYVLYSNIQARIAVLTAEDRARSWIDPATMTSLRYHKHERNPLFSRDEQVELMPDKGVWEGADGTKAPLATNTPMDELSFIYFLRSIVTDEPKVLRIERHFDARRNPVVVHILGSEAIETAIGEMPTTLVEMRVKDVERFGGEGVIRFNFSQDPNRIPLRIKTHAPIVGPISLEMMGYSPGMTDPSAASVPKIPCPTNR